MSAPSQILFVSRAPPNANGRGVDRRAAQHLATLQALGSVTLVIPAGSAAEAAAEGHDLGALGLEQLVVRPDRTQAAVSHDRYVDAGNPLTRIWTGLRRMHHIHQVALPADARAFRKRLEQRFDLVFCYRMSSAVWLDSLGRGARADEPRVVDFDDVESTALIRAALTQKQTPFWRLIELKSALSLRGVEARMMRSWDGVCVCSEEDAERLGRRGPLTPWVTPNTFAFPSAPNALRAAGAPLRVLFVGTLSYAPNAEGLAWFVERVWPAVRTARADATLSIVGIATPASVQAMDGRDGVEVLGRLESLDAAYADADLVIAPIFSGGGTRIKLIEAFARGRPVVSTTIGAEGLDVRDGEHLLIADDARAFTDAVLRLAADAPSRQSLADAAFRAAKARFDAVAVRETLQRRLTDLMAGGEKP